MFRLGVHIQSCFAEARVQSKSCMWSGESCLCAHSLAYAINIASVRPFSKFLQESFRQIFSCASLWLNQLGF